MPRKTISWLVAGASLLASSAALAEETATPLSGSAAAAGTGSVGGDPSAEAQRAGQALEPDGKLDEIIVTAQRRAQSLVSVPLSISAATGAALTSSGLRDLRDLQYLTPGFSSTAGVGFTQLYIRGIGNNIFVGADPSVATFIDDVPRVYANLVPDFLNVERVEVLKGAQGGLYGRNATGGVINIITMQPDDEMAMRARISAGTYETLEAEGYVNVPLGEAAAMNLALTRKYHDPYVNNIAVPNYFPEGSPGAVLNSANRGTPARVNDRDTWSVDGKLRVNLGEDAKITLAGDYNVVRGAEGIAGVNRQPALAYGVFRNLLRAFGYNVEAIAPANGTFPTPTGRDVYYAGFGQSHLDDYGASARIEVALDNVDLTSISAMRWNATDFYQENGYAPIAVIGTHTAYAKKNFYQELRAVSTADGPLNLLGGVTYFRDRIDSEVVVHTFGVRNNPATDTVSRLRTRSWSVYGQAAYDVTERLTLTGSLRYIHEKKDIVFPLQPQVPPNAPFPEVRGGSKVHKWLPSVTLSYDLDDGTVYARWARGFKTGGINPIARPNFFPTAEGSEFAGETVDTFEVGYRAQLFDRKVQFTSAIFYNDYKDLQITRGGRSGLQPIQLIYLNAGSARTYGAEANVTWRVAEPLTLSASLGYLNAKYKEFSNAGSPVIGLAPFDSSGKRMILAPEWQAGAGVNLDQPVSDSLRLSANMLYSYTSDTQFDDRNLPETEQKAYSLVNGRIGLVTMDDKLGVYVFARNLFNKYYYTFISGRAFGIGGQPGAPRVLGGTVEMKF